MPGYLVAGALFVVTAGLGVWLGALGRPYGVLLLTGHKLIALAATVSGVALVRSAIAAAQAPSRGTTAAIAIVAVAVVALFATGGLMSAGRMPVSAGRAVHSVATVVAAVSAIAVWRMK
jgi:hypothetical protein